MADHAASPEDLLKPLHWRYATKKFDSTKKIPEETWKILEQSLLLSPSSFGLQPWKFFVIKNPDLRRQFVEAAWGQSQVVDASHLVVFAAKKDLNAADVDRYVGRMAEVQHTTVEALQGFSNTVKGFLENTPTLNADEWAKRQTYIALGFYMLTAASLGIDTCPMEGFIPEKVDQLLGLNEQGYASVALCPAGYRAADDQNATRPKVRYDLQEVLQTIE